MAKVQLTTPLSDYAVLAGSQIVNTGSSMVKNGNFGSKDDPQPSGIVCVNGVNDTANITMAQTQLQEVINVLIDNANIMSDPPMAIVDGECIFYSGGYVTKSQLTFGTNSMITFDAQGNSDAQFYVHVGQLVFEDTEFQLINGAQFQNIYWLSDGDILCPANNLNLYGNFVANGSVTLSFGVSVIGRIYAQNGTITLVSNNIVMTESEQPVPCYLKGTKILTRKGYVCVEDLKVGDLLVTRGDIHGNDVINRVLKYRPITWIGHFIIKNPHHEVLPICVRKNTYGINLPINNLYISPDHNLVIHGVLVPSVSLIDKKNICKVAKADKLDYYHVGLEKHSVIVAEGILSESYIDIHNKYVFKHASKLKQKGIKK